MGNALKATPRVAASSGARVVPLNIETARQLGGGARGRTLAIIYRQLCYWSKYAKWRGSKNRKFFYKSQKELASELGYSEKTISRAVKALRELGLVVVEKLHKHYWRQVFFYYLPHSPFAAAELPQSITEDPTAPPSASPAPVAPTTTNPNSRSALSAAAATAASIRARGGAGFGQNVRIQHKKDNPFIKQTLQSIVEKCELHRRRLMDQQEWVPELVA